MGQDIDKPEALNDRARHLLRFLVDRYIREGQPVGSRALAKDTGLDLSPATIRNVMADLEELGYVTAPHTSAGRMPTVKGYRFFVDSLLRVQAVEEAEARRIDTEVRAPESTSALLHNVSHALSDLTRMAGVVMVPKRNHAALRQVEFLPIGERRVLAILVVNEREVQNRVIETDREYSPAELVQAANFLNAQFAGRDIAAVRAELLREMRAARAELDGMMQAALSMAERTFNLDPQEEDYVLHGETNLMGFSDLADVQRLRELFEAFGRKHAILRLLDQSLGAGGVQIFIGSESGHEVLEQCSVVTAPYGAHGRVLGVLGVIGPTRMAYERVIPVVELTARKLGDALAQR